MKQNKYEDIEMFDISGYEDVIDIIHDSAFPLDNDEYIAVYGKRELISFLLTELLKRDCEFGYANFDMLDDMLQDQILLMLVRGNYLVSVEPAFSTNGNIIKHDAVTSIISMDDCKQDVVNYCVNSDKEVILVGESDDSEYCYHCSCNCSKCYSNTDIEYPIAVTCNLDADIKDLESRISNINDMYKEMDNLRRLFI